MAFIGDELPLAIEHAGFAPDRVKVWTCTGGERDGCRAIWFKPTMKIDDDRFLSDEQKQEAELPEHRDKHRIAIFHDAPIAADLASALVGALLRHELEHARQFDVAGVTTLDIHETFYSQRSSAWRGACRAAPCSTTSRRWRWTPTQRRLSTNAITTVTRSTPSWLVTSRNSLERSCLPTTPAHCSREPSRACICSAMYAKP